MLEKQVSMPLLSDNKMALISFGIKETIIMSETPQLKHEENVDPADEVDVHFTAR